MKVLGFGLFHGAGATGHVFFVKNGRTKSKGLAYSGLIGPMTTVAVVPTVSQATDFIIEVRSKDNQLATVIGSLNVVLDSSIAVSKFDFTVDENGAYVNDWQTVLKTTVIEQVLGPVQKKAITLDVVDLVKSQKDFETEVMTQIAGTSAALAQKGIIVESCSIPKITPNDNDVRNFLGAKEKQEMLAKSDEAFHKRQMDAAKNVRELKEYEVETEKTVAQKRADVIEEESKNKQAEAKADKEAIETKLTAFTTAEPGKILGAAILAMAENGRIGNLNLTTELLAAVGFDSKSNNHNHG